MLYGHILALHAAVFGAGIQHVFQLIHKGVDIAELAVDGSKAHIGNVVHLFQLLHGKVPNIDGGHFPVVRVQQHLFNAADGGIQLLQVVPEGKKPMDGTSFAAGLRLKTGDVL